MGSALVALAHLLPTSNFELRPSTFELVQSPSLYTSKDRFMAGMSPPRPRDWRRTARPSWRSRRSSAASWRRCWLSSSDAGARWPCISGFSVSRWPSHSGTSTAISAVRKPRRARRDHCNRLRGRPGHPSVCEGNDGTAATCLKFEVQSVKFKVSWKCTFHLLSTLNFDLYTCAICE